MTIVSIFKGSGTPRSIPGAERSAGSKSVEPSLGDRQSAFTGAILKPDAPIPAGLVGPRGQVSALRFAVYRNNVILGLVEALKAAFPTLCALVGEDFFAAMAREFALLEPPTSPVMHEYGAGFPSFVAGFGPAAELPYLGDVARLEWAWVEAYHAAEASPLPHAAIAGACVEGVERARLTLHPATRVICSDFPIVTIWEMHAGPEGMSELNLDDRGQDALVSRAGADVEIRRLPAGAAPFVAALLMDASIAEAAQAGLSASAEFDLARALAGLIEADVIVGFEPSGPDPHHSWERTF